MISIINDDRYSKFDKFDKETILQKLNQSISTPNDFELNSEAYIPSSGNLKHKKIVEAFKPLNIDLNVLDKNKHLEISMIDDLVVRRNDISHGVQVDDILDVTVLQEYINSLKTYIKSIFDILIQKEIEYQFKHQIPIYIDEPKEFYQNNTVCIVTIKDIEIKVGDSLFIEKNKKISKTIILDIKKDDVSIQSVNDGEVGLKLDCTIKKNSKIWKLQR